MCHHRQTEMAEDGLRVKHQGKQSQVCPGRRRGSGTRGAREGTGAGTAPVEGQQQGPQRGEEGLLDAGQAAVLGGGCVQAFESQEGQREQPVCQDRASTVLRGQLVALDITQTSPYPPSFLRPPRPSLSVAGATASWLSGEGYLLGPPSTPLHSTLSCVHVA